MNRTSASSLVILLCGLTPFAASGDELETLLSRKIIDPELPRSEVQAFVETHVRSIPPVESVARWEQHAGQLRADVLDRVVFRGEAASWRTLETKVEWLETIDGGPGYAIRKLRYEAVPGLWIPALLYEPANLDGRVPVVLNVNGHDRPKGKAAEYKQIRCINQAKRGMLALNVEWLGMGQLHAPNFRHTRMNQLDLCGTSGLAPFYLSLKRGLDVLLAHEHADPQRVAVTGLSGGGWQTILISALDTRVTLANPVAGYGSLRTAVRVNDLGDSEQSPSDLGAIADYGVLTALMAPRPTLLTYNAKDDCCFRAAHALPPLLAAARPIFQLYGKEQHLRKHVNHDPGTHNYEKDNREALYRMLCDHFFANDATFDAEEIECSAEVKTTEQLAVALPPQNADFHHLALQLSKDLPRQSAVPDGKDDQQWSPQRRKKLHDLVRARRLDVHATMVGSTKQQATVAGYWQLKMSDAWTVPLVELTQGSPKKTAIVVADAGRESADVEVARLLRAGYRVLAVDPFSVGESTITGHDPAYTYPLILDAAGQRPLGLQAAQIGAVARWSGRQFDTGAVTVVSAGPRSSLMCLVAGCLEETAIGALTLHDSLASLKDVITKNATVEEYPEVFCFGLLEEFDVEQLAALFAPRPLEFNNAK